MIVREAFKCNACGEDFLARLGIGSGLLPLIFQCPHCGAALRASMEPDPEAMELHFKSGDVTLLETKQSDELTSVTIYADLPVPKALQGIPAKEAVASPFILFAQVIGNEELSVLMARIEHMRRLRSQIFPRLR